MHIHPLRASVEGATCETLPYGEFYGVFKCRFDIPQFSLAVVAFDDLWAKGKRHTHETAHVIFVMDGEYILSSGATERKLPPRSVIFVPEGTTHQNRPATSKTRVLTVSISRSQIEQALEYVDLPETESPFVQDEVLRLVSRLEGECHDWKRTSPLTASGLCLELLGAFGQDPRVKERTAPRWLRQAKELLHDQCCQSVTITDIASTVGVHPIHLSRTFRRFFHCTAGEYQRRCRTEKGSELLRSGEKSIAQVAIDAGFTDQSHFSKSFRQMMGTTPGQYRRAMSASHRLDASIALD